MARLPRGTGLSPSSRRNCAGSKRNRPNEISRVVAPAGLPAFSWLAFGLWRGRLTSELESEFNLSNNGASAIGKRSEAAVDPDTAKLDDRFHETGTHGTGDLFVDSSFGSKQTRSGIMAGIDDINRYPVIHAWSYKLVEAA
jgi:hypothetical protein